MNKVNWRCNFSCDDVGVDVSQSSQSVCLFNVFVTNINVLDIVSDNR